MVLDILRKIVLATAATALLGGCAALTDGPPQTVSGKAALDALARGDYVSAETEAAQAVRQHPNDPYALIALALTYELTGRPLQAREYYLIVQALNPEGTIVLNDGIERRLIDVARVRLAALTTPAQGAPGRAAAGEQAWSNALRRFQTLRRLVQAGLATDSEYGVRRAANGGALLPYSESPAAVGLDQPPPSYETVAERLQAINRALELKSISPRDHAMERVAILDGLLPANPRERVVTAPGLDPLVAPAYLGHLQKLRGDGLISAEEAARERAAVERIAGPASMPGVTQAPLSAPTAATPAKPAAKDKKAVKDKKAAKPSKATAPPGKAAAPAKPAAGAAAGAHGIHLASFSSEAKAREGFEQLRRRFPDLAALQPNILRVDLGAKGIFFRLRAGPLANRQAAQAVCAKLKAGGQYCDPVAF